MTTLQIYAHRLSDPDLAIGLKVTIANELRDQVEVFQTSEYPKFLSTLLPLFLDILQNEQPVFISNAPEQKLRNIILEIIYRLPQTEALKEYVPELCRTLMKILRVENEDNAVVCVKIIIDLHRSFRQVLEDQVQPFLDIVQEIFQNMETTVKEAFDNPDQVSTPSSIASPRPMSPAADVPDAPSKILPKSMFSFKVLTECPIIVVLLFQSYRRSAAENIMKFVPLIFQTLSLQAKPQMEAAAAAAAKGELFIGVSPAIKQKSLYNEFIVAQTLSVAGLEGLARLLELLTNYFKVEIGKKLLDHLKQWAEPKVLQEAIGKPVHENHEIKIIVAILNIFHLLPAAAYIFLDELVTVVLEMEGHIRRSVSSPFRPNLVKYLNRYPVETVNYFFEKLDDVRYFQLFVDILNTESASRLRDEVANKTSELVSKTFKHESNSNGTLPYNGVVIVQSLFNYDSNYLTEHDEVLTCIREFWHSQEKILLEQQHKEEDKEIIAIARRLLTMSKIFVSYLRQDLNNIDLIFDLVGLYAQKAVLELSFLQKFFLEDVALKASPAIKRGLLEKFLQKFTDRSVSSYLKIMLIRQVINPAILATFAVKNDDYMQIFDSAIMEQLDRKVWANLTMGTDDDNQYIEDSLCIELLQLTATMVQYAPQLLADRRKEVIKFGWNFLRLEDATIKQAAYVLISHFIAAYETPNKITIQIYAALLRAHSSEARILVKQGLDIIASVLPQRLPIQNNERVPTWIRLTRKVVVEDTHSISQMVNVYQLLIRHSDLFFEYREHFLPQIVNTLPKLGLLQNATPEHKLLTVELAELIIKWEKKRISLQASIEEASTSSSGKRKLESDGASESPTKKMQVESSSGNIEGVASSSMASGRSTTVKNISEADKEYAPSLVLRENVIGYLVRLSCGVYNPNDMMQKRLVSRTIELVKSLLSPDLWPDVHIRLNHLERPLMFREVNELIAPSVCSALEILNADIAHRSTEWFIVNMTQLHRLLEGSIRTENSRIQNALYPVLIRIMEAIHQYNLSLKASRTSNETSSDDQIPEPNDETKASEAQNVEMFANTEITADDSNIASMDVDQTTAIKTEEIEEPKEKLIEQPPQVIAFMNLINTTIQEGLNSMSNLYGVLKLLEAVSSSDGEFLDPYIPAISKMAQLLTKEHTLPPEENEEHHEIDINLLILGLSLMKKRIGYLGDHRLYFLSCLVQLMEKSEDTRLLNNILDMLNEWVMNDANPMPTVKEKAGLLGKMMAVEGKKDPKLIGDFLQLVLKIYSTPSLANSELTTRLEQAFLYGTQYKDPEIPGLDVINNTNLMYFTHQQKAEFFTLKGMFLAKMQHYNEANEAFVNAVQIDLTLPRAWGEWGKYNDKRFKENPKDLSWANSAVSCYLQAAGLYKNAKSRKYLLRILWLLTHDDQSGIISRAVEGYKGEWPVWYWITFIPQLLTALQHKEGRHARYILIRIAKQFPQALHFQLRTAKEDMMKRTSTLQASLAAESAQQQKGDSESNTSQKAAMPTETTSSSSSTKDGTPMETDNEVKKETTDNAAGFSTEGTTQGDTQEKKDPVTVKTEDSATDSSTCQQNGLKNGSSSPALSQQQNAGAGMLNLNTGMQNIPQGPGTPRGMTPGQMGHPGGQINPLDEIMATLKTGYPLLALSMETMVDQIQLKFKPQADEDMYRLVVALYNEGAQQLLTRLSNPNDTFQLTQATVTNIQRFADSLYPGHMKTAFVNDFAKSRLNLEEYVAKLRLWRDKFEAMLDARPRRQKLEAASHYLVEFQHQKFDDVEIPGQYLALKDNANDFLRIDRFLPEVEIIRNYGNCYRRLVIRGHDGSLHPFLVQNPVARQFRREERLMQLFRLLNYIIEGRKETRARNLSFYLPAIVPLAPNVRMVQDDTSYISLYDVYEDHCDGIDMHKDSPLVYFIEKFKKNVNAHKDIVNQKTELLNLRMEINDYIAANMVPPNILSKYLLKAMSSYTDYWMLRKRFIAQYATATFMAYIFSVGNRMPHKIMISRRTGNVWMTEFLPGWNTANPVFGNGEAIPFRFTPNIQDFITPIGIEGPFASCLMATARCLTEPDFQLDQYICLFVRDELATWHLANHRSATDIQFRERVNQNVLQVQTKAQFLSCKADREKTLSAGKPLNQNVIDLISQASNPQKMAQMECTWMPWL
ncbi:Putative Transformation/transcription domain-associated protein [Rhizopus microsporus]|nr:Putative Transformation/transcription domain-associated protein [Rhizopus microsporus]